MGSKSVDTLEIVCKHLSFYPSLAAESSGKDLVTLPSSSAVHNIFIPLLERLRLPDKSSVTMGKIRECLNKFLPVFLGILLSGERCVGGIQFIIISPVPAEGAKI